MNYVSKMHIFVSLFSLLNLSIYSSLKDFGMIRGELGLFLKVSDQCSNAWRNSRCLPLPPHPSRRQSDPWSWCSLGCTGISPSIQQYFFSLDSISCQRPYGSSHSPDDCTYLMTSECLATRSTARKNCIVKIHDLSSILLVFFVELSLSLRWIHLNIFIHRMLLVFKKSYMDFVAVTL